MKKTAATDFEIHELLGERWSPRAFNPEKEISTEQMQRLFEAARWAASGSNEQPWSFLIGFKGDETYARIFETLVEFNQLWAKTAPVLLLSCGRKFSTKNPEQPNPSYQYDVGQAVANMSIQATQEGLFMHQMGGFDAKLAAELLSVPFDYEVLTAIAIGFPGEVAKLHPNLQKLEDAARVRNDFDEFVFQGTFGRKSKLFK